MSINQLLLGRLHLLAMVQVLLITSNACSDHVYQATGFRIGEVTSTSAILWTRLTLREQRNPADGPTVTIKYVDDDFDKSQRRGKVEAVVYPEGVAVGDLRGAAPGTAGEVRVKYRPPDTKVWSETKWQAVDAQRDFTHQFKIEGLVPDTKYELIVEGRSDAASLEINRLEGRLATAPSSEEPKRVVFTVSTGQGNNDRDSPDGFKIYGSMLKLMPSFFAHTGDMVYYDQIGKTVPLARYHWQRTYSLPSNVNFHRQVPSYFEKDDHDTWVNDCWPTMQSDYMHEFTFAQGQSLFLEQMPIGPQIYRTFRWGKDLQVWLVEGRDFRSPNNAPDGPGKTIWGAEQKAWFMRTMRASDATFRVLISPTPVVGPDRSKKNDNHSNAGFQHEGRELRAFLASQKNAVVVCGDRHWQYMSADPNTGLREYSCGPASNKHAGGWSKSDFVEEYHRFLRVKGGFLSVTIERVDNRPTLTARFHGVGGKVYFEDSFVAE
ncbi:MAG: alkaline phosphatase D family protein [Planctomycetota bacterium]